MKEKKWIKVYEVCPECDGTGWTKNDCLGSAFPDCPCDNGKVGEFIEIDKYIQNNEIND